MAYKAFWRSTAFVLATFGLTYAQLDARIDSHPTPSSGSTKPIPGTIWWRIHGPEAHRIFVASKPVKATFEICIRTELKVGTKLEVLSENQAGQIEDDLYVFNKGCAPGSGPPTPHSSFNVGESIWVRIIRDYPTKADGPALPNDEAEIYFLPLELSS